MTAKTKKRLSIDELKSYPGFENFTDEMAEETIASLKSIIHFVVWALSKNKSAEGKLNHTYEK